LILFIDSYAVSVGSIHGCKNKCKKIDFKLLEKIHNEVDKPLVIHGSSGVVDDDLKVLYQYGVVKVNIETELRMIYKIENMMIRRIWESLLSMEVYLMPTIFWRPMEIVERLRLIMVFLIMKKVLLILVTGK